MAYPWWLKISKEGNSYGEVSPAPIKLKKLPSYSEDMGGQE